MAKTTFTQEETAERLGVTRTTLWRWQKKWVQSHQKSFPRNVASSSITLQIETVEDSDLKVGKVRAGHNAGDWIFTDADVKAIERWIEGSKDPE
jgi:Homeodomain-like domain